MQRPLPLLSTQPTNLDAVVWGLDHLDATIEAAAHTLDRALKVVHAWNEYEEVRGRLHGEHRNPIFGVQLATHEAEAALSKLGERVTTTQNTLMKQAFAQLIEFCGASPPPERGLFSRLADALGSRPPSPRPPDFASAGRLVASARWELFAPLLEHVSPAVRRVVAEHLAEGGHAELERLLAVEQEPRVIGAIVQRLHQLASPTSEEPLSALLRRLPAEGEFRRVVVRALLRVNANAATTLLESRSVSDRLAVLVALQDAFESPHLPHFLRGGLADEDPRVVLEALRLVARLEFLQLTPELIPHATHVNDEVRASAIEVLGVVGRHRSAAAQALIGLLDGADRARALGALRSILQSRRVERSVVTTLAESAGKLGEDLKHRVLELREQFHPDVVDTAPEDEFEQELALHPNDARRFLVYADQLTARGDPRGELIVRSHAAQPILEFIRQHPIEIFGPLAELLGDALTQVLSATSWDGATAHFTWNLGFVRRATAQLLDDHDATMAQLVAAIFRAPACRLLTELRIGDVPTELEFSDVLDVLVRAPQARRLTHLAIGLDDDIFNLEAGDLSSIWSALPALASFTVNGSAGALGHIDAPSLRTLSIKSWGYEANIIASLVQMTTPRLEHLELLNSWGDQVDFSGFFARADLPCLRRLTLRGELGANIFELLVNTPVLRGLEALDLSDGEISTTEFETVLEKPLYFRHLKRLDLNGDVLGELGDDLQRALPGVRLSAQVDP